ncbi:hypothetical protein GYA54_04500 [Candidatus Kuenenbacteria bacterium]|nr:hypothetical protein [Candidatus Kuenenbacteria bacterium]
MENQKENPELIIKKPPQKIHGGILVLIGYLLSPFSWWNDLILNIPIAYFFSLPFGLISQKIFLPAMIFGYWLTNVVGLMLVHYGAIKALGKEHEHSKKRFFKHFIIATLYTLIIFLLFKINFLQLPDFNCFIKK